MLSRMWWPDFPVPVGVLRDIERPTHDQLVVGQIEDAITRQGAGDLDKLLAQRRDLDGPGLGRRAADDLPVSAASTTSRASTSARTAAST